MIDQELLTSPELKEAWHKANEIAREGWKIGDQVDYLERHWRFKEAIPLMREQRKYMQDAYIILLSYGLQDSKLAKLIKLTIDGIDYDLKEMTGGRV